MHRFLGVALTIISAIGFGTLAILGRYALADGMDAPTILFLRFSFAALVMLAWLALRRQPLPRGRTLLMLIGMGAIGYVGQAFAYLTALAYASSGLVALLLYLYPIFVAVLSVVLLHERFTPPKVAALGLALGGIAITVGPAGGQIYGIVLAISAAAIYSVYIIVGARVMRDVTAVQSSAVIFASAGAVSGLIMATQGAQWPASSAGWAAIAGIVVLATLVPVVAFLAGLERIGPTNAAMLSTLEPVVTVLLAVVLLGELLQPVTLIGGGLILVAVLLLTRSELRSSTRHAAVSAPLDENDELAQRRYRQIQ